MPGNGRRSDSIQSKHGNAKKCHLQTDSAALQSLETKNTLEKANCHNGSRAGFFIILTKNVSPRNIIAVAVDE